MPEGRFSSPSPLPGRSCHLLMYSPSLLKMEMRLSHSSVTYAFQSLSKAMAVGHTMEPSSKLNSCGPCDATPRAKAVTYSSSSSVKTVMRVPSGRYSEARHSTYSRSPSPRATKTGEVNPGPNCSPRPMVWLYCRMTEDATVGMFTPHSIWVDQNLERSPLPVARGSSALRLTYPLARLALLEEVKLLECPTDDRLRIHLHPLFQQGSVQAAEIVVEVEVPLQ